MRCVLLCRHLLLNMARNKGLNAAGYFLLEYIISLLLVSLMLLGLASQTLFNFKQAENVSDISIANRQIESMAERLTVVNGQDDSVFVANWNQENKLLLPNGHGKIAGTYPHYLISIAWGRGHADCSKTSIHHQAGCLITRL